MTTKSPSSLCLLATVSILCGCAGDRSGPADAKKTARPSRHYEIEDFMDTTRIGGASFSADESAILVSSDESGIFNAYSIAIASTERTPVTRSTNDSTYAVSYFPKDNRVLFTRDKGGDEHNHLFVRELDGTERDLTPGEKLKASFDGWTRDDRAFYFQTNERDKRFFDLYRMNAATYARTTIYEDNTGYQLGAISDDGQWLAFEKPNTTADSDIYLYNMATKNMKHISPHKKTARYDVAAFDRTSRWLYFLTNDGDEFTRVRRHELATGKTEDVERASWDVMFTYFSHNGKYRVTGINEDARTVIKVYEHATGGRVQLPQLPEGDVTSVTISRSEKRMAFYVNSDRQPGNLYAYEFGTRKPKQLTDTLSKKIDPLDLVDSEVTRFKSFDGLAIPNVLYKPHQATRRTKAPALVWVHGGPGGQTRKGYSAQIQYLVNHGYVVLGINNRGSSGYGKTFFIADDQKHGREPLWDCVEAKKYLASLPYVDPERIGIIGGSYGGYMVLAALAFKPDEFDCGVDIFGVSNWLRTLENTPPWWEAFKRALYTELGNPATDREMLRAISPLFHADKIKKPLLVLQGANDPRVVKAESDDIVAAVKKNTSKSIGAPNRKKMTRREYNWIRYAGRARMYVWNSGGPINAPHERVLQLLICPWDDINESWTVYRHEADPSKEGKIVCKRWECEPERARFRKLMQKTSDVWDLEPAVLEKHFPVSGRWVKDLDLAVGSLSVPPICGTIREQKRDEQRRLLFWRGDQKSEFAWNAKPPPAWQPLEHLFGRLLREFRQYADAKPLPSVRQLA